MNQDHVIWKWSRNVKHVNRWGTQIDVTYVATLPAPFE
jgi:hypothetical protein